MSKIEQAKIVVDVIQNMIDVSLRKATYNRKVKAFIVSVNEDNTANIKINDRLYENVSVRKGLDIQNEDIVWVEIPNNSIKDMYVDVVL